MMKNSRLLKSYYPLEIFLLLKEICKIIFLIIKITHYKFYYPFSPGYGSFPITNLFGTLIIGK